MLSPVASLGAAVIAFYVPALAAAFVLLIRSKRPRMAYFFLFAFTLVRLGSGITAILSEEVDKLRGNIALAIVDLMLVGVGVIPLTGVNIGLVRILIKDLFPKSQFFKRYVVVIRLLFLCALAFFIAGARLSGDPTLPKLHSLGHTLVEVGYSFEFLLLAILVGFQVYLWLKHRYLLSRKCLIVVSGASVSVPPLIIRATYSILSITQTEPGSKWNTLSGSIGIFVVMALLMEYIIVLVTIAVGFSTRKLEPAEAEVEKGSS